MYIIAWWDVGVYELVGDATNVLALAAILENQKIKFKISDRNGVLRQSSLGCNGFEFWVEVF